MPRIPDELIERIKVEVPVRTLAERTGMELKAHGENLVGLCVFHDDRKTANLVITPATNLFHCFACGAAGSPIDWVMKTEGVSFRAAVEILLLEFFPAEARALGIGMPPKKSTVPALASPIDPDGSEEEAFDGVALYYHHVLKETPEALAFLERRGVADDQTIARLRLGFCDRTLGTRLPNMNRKAGFAMRTKLQKLGLYRANGREHFRGCLTIPFLDSAGHVVGMYGRRIESHLPSDVPPHLYSAGPHRGLLNSAALRESKEIVLCEAPIDAVTFFRWGFLNVTTAYGVEGFTDELFEAFVGSAIERCFIAFDRDEAGDRGARKVADRLMAAGVECYRVLFPKGMDANEVALKMAPADKTLGHFIRSAEWMGRGAPPRGGAPAPSEAAKSAPSAAPPSTNDGAAKEGMSGAQALETAAETSETSRVDRFAQVEPSSDAAAPSAAELNGDDEALFRFEDRSYRVQGLKKALAHGSLQVRVHAQRDGDFFGPSSPIQGWFLDRFDFVSALARSRFEKSAAHEMGVKPETVKWDLGRVLRRLEELQRKAIEEALKPKAATPAMTDEERADGLDYGSAPQLVERILLDFERSGVVGEKTNALAGYLGGISRLAERPLAIIIRSSSAAGKTVLMDAILRFIPKESCQKYSALSGQALFYFEGKDFKHKVLAIVEEEGASRAGYALKLLQSEGEITIASTGKDPGTGRLVTKEYRVEGPLMILLASTSVEIDDELLNRAIVLTVDEGRDQTRAIHQLQRESQTLEGLWAKDDREEIYRVHHNFQRLLRPLAVVNPFVRELTFLDDRTRTRRDHTKYLGIIEAVTLLHQFQRPLKSDTRGSRTKEYIEATLDDVALANRLAAEVLGRTLDELGPQTRRFVMLLDEMVTETCARHGVARSDFHFSRRDVRLFTNWSPSQIAIHLSRLQEMEYLLVHRGRNGQSFVYELLYDGKGKEGERFVIGLADVEAIARERGLPVPTLPPSLEPLPPVPTNQTFRTFEPTFRGASGPLPATFRAASGSTESAPEAASEPISAENAETPHLEAGPKSYAQGVRTRISGAASGNGHRPRLRLNLLRFPPAPLTAPPGGDGDGVRSHRQLLIRCPVRGF
jgi:DNA primase catalytic core